MKQNQVIFFFPKCRLEVPRSTEDVECRSAREHPRVLEKFLVANRSPPDVREPHIHNELIFELTFCTTVVFYIPGPGQTIP